MTGTGPNDAERPRRFARGGLAVALLGLVVLPVWGVLAVFSSDACSPDSPAYYCSGAGQQLGTRLGLAAGLSVVPFAIAGGMAPKGSHFARAWPWYCVCLQVAAFLTIADLSSHVS